MKLFAVVVVSVILNHSNVWTAEPPSDLKIAVSTHRLSLDDIKGSEAKKSETFKLGPIDFDLIDPVLSHKLGGLSLREGKLTVQSAHLELRYGEVTGKNVLIIDVPHIEMVRKEKTILGQRVVYDEPQTVMKRESKETKLLSLKDPAVVVDKKPEADWSFDLPKKIKFKLSRSESDRSVDVSIEDKQEIVSHLKRSIEEAFSDQVLGSTLTFRPENVSDPIKALMENRIEAHKPNIFSALRDALKREVEKAEFFKNLEQKIARELPPMLLRKEDSLFAHLVLGPNSTLCLGPENFVATLPTDSSMEYGIAVNQQGMDTLTRTFLYEVARKEKIPGVELGSEFKFDPKQAQLIYRPNSLTREELAELLAGLSGTEIPAEQLTAVGIELLGGGVKPRTTFKMVNGTKVLELQLGISAILHQTTVLTPVRFQFSISERGDLVLQKIYSHVYTPRSADGAKTSGLVELLKRTLKLNLALAFMNTKLQDLQEPNQSSSKKFVFDMLEITNPAGRKEPVLRLRIGQ
ncbi:MAG: hypothetical protein HY537_04520 [Deltaproteobacteria bacterium]|nr:hypothetical protein [Deltaproteobacteria bacterium]